MKPTKSSKPKMVEATKIRAELPSPTHLDSLKPLNLHVVLINARISSCKPAASTCRVLTFKLLSVGSHLSSKSMSRVAISCSTPKACQSSIWLGMSQSEKHNRDAIHAGAFLNSWQWDVLRASNVTQAFFNNILSSRQRPPCATCRRHLEETYQWVSSLRAHSPSSPSAFKARWKAAMYCL